MPMVLGGVGVSVALVLGVFLLLKSGGAPAGASSDPQIRDVVARFTGAVKAGQSDTVWNMLSKKSQGRFERDAPGILDSDRGVLKDDAVVASNYGLSVSELHGFNGKMLLRKMMLKDEPWTILEQTDNPSISGRDNARTARLKAKSDSGAAPVLKLVWEDGKWKLELDPDWK